MKSYGRVFISLEQNPGSLLQQMVSLPGEEDGQGPLSHEMLVIPLLGKVHNI